MSQLTIVLLFNGLQALSLDESIERQHDRLLYLLSLHKRNIATSLIFLRQEELLRCHYKLNFLLHFQHWIEQNFKQLDHD